MAGAPPLDASDEARHADAAVEEWLFTCCTGAMGVVSGYRIVGRTAWYWAAVARAGEPLVHVTEWAVPRRADPLLVKADGLWAEHTCDAPMEQWTVANETYAAALDDPDDALGRAYGTPTAVAFDLEWYATGKPAPVESGYEQVGVVHGVIELAGTSRAAPRGGAGASLAPLGRTARSGPAPGGLRPQRRAGAVRVPGRHGVGLGVDAGRLARPAAGPPTVIEWRVALQSRWVFAGRPLAPQVPQ